MFRRSILELSSRRPLNRIPQCISSQIPSFLLSRKEFLTSSSPKSQTPKPGENSKPEELKNGVSPVFLGGAIVAGAGLAAYQLGYLDHLVGREPQKVQGVVDGKDDNETHHAEKPAPTTIAEVPKLSDMVEQDVQKLQNLVDLPHAETGQKVEEEEKNVETHKDFPHVEASKPKVEANADLTPVEADSRIDNQAGLPYKANQGESLSYGQETNVEKDDSTIPLEEKHNMESSQSTDSLGSLSVESSRLETSGDDEAAQASEVAKANETKVVPLQHFITLENSEVTTEEGADETRLLEAYHLKEQADGSSKVGRGDQALAGGVEESSSGYITEDGKLVMDFLHAIHAAEKRQAELDARTYAEQKRLLKEKYEKELKDLRARELMRAEEVAMLDKEIKREKAKAAAAIKAIQEKMEEKLRVELEQKEKETEMELKKIQELAKAELAAQIASEKATQIEKMAEANLHINALCMAFYARSEEARQIHSVHKLALGALALEDALSKGQPIQQELDALNMYLDGIDKDSLIHLVLSTLPEETRSNGTDTLLQLNQKFKALKGTLRQYILIPPGGGGILAHALSRVASWLRIKDADSSGDGIESVFSRVETFLAQGRLAEAAEALEEGVRGSKAEEVADDWVTRARNRAITEQALTVLQSYATSISLTQ